MQVGGVRPGKTDCQPYPGFAGRCPKNWACRALNLPKQGIKSTSLQGGEGLAQVNPVGRIQNKMRSQHAPHRLIPAHPTPQNCPALVYTRTRATQPVAGPVP